MAWKTEIETDQSGLKLIYAFEEDAPDIRFLVYRIDSANRLIEFIPKPSDDFALDSIILEGFSALPDEFAPAGYIQTGLMYYLDKKIREGRISRLTISSSRPDSIRKVRNKDQYRMVLNYASFRNLKSRLTHITTEAKKERSAYVDGFFHSLFPNRFSPISFAARRRATRVVRDIDEDIIPHLSKDDTERLLDFYRSFLSQKYTSLPHKLRLLGAAKVRVDEVALSAVIRQFEELLDDNPAESRWGQFLKKNLFLIESKYIKIISELNVVLAGARKVDFGLIDSQGYLDLFEIKKPSTRLLASRKDRGNYYWSSQAVKALVQAEKYLFNADRKASSLAEDINRERGLTVRVVRPRVVVVMGHSDQLDSETKREDFRVLRMSLKNLEIVLYDELLERLRNQMSKIYIEEEAELATEAIHDSA